MHNGDFVRWDRVVAKYIGFYFFRYGDDFSAAVRLKLPLLDLQKALGEVLNEIIRGAATLPAAPEIKERIE